MTFKVCKLGMKEGIIFDAREVRRNNKLWDFLTVTGERKKYWRTKYNAFIYIPGKGWVLI